MPRKYVPVLELRDPYILKMHDPTWSLRNRTNTPHARIPLAWGGSIRYHHMGHTYGWYFPPDKYFAEHPEYFALVNGKRQPSQLCYTNEDVIRLSIEKTCEIFRNHPEVTITGIGPNDGRGFCDCPDCKQLDDENGGRSGSYFHMVNRIAEGVKKEFPNNHLISPGVPGLREAADEAQGGRQRHLQLCTDSHAWKYQFCSVWESEEFQEIIKAWHARKARMFIWDYTTDYVHYLLPMPNWPVVAENTRFNIRNGAAGIMYESEMNDCDEMRAWVWAKQLWDPALDTRALLHDFVFGYYKESAEPLWDFQMMMWDYWEKWHALPHKCGVGSGNPLLNNLQCSYAPDGPMFTPGVHGADEERLRRGGATCANDDEIRARVKRAKLSLLYLELGQQPGLLQRVRRLRLRQEHPAGRAPTGRRYSPRWTSSPPCASSSRSRCLGIAGSTEKIVGKWQACIDAETAGQPRVFLPGEWVFAADPADKGVRERWFADQHYFDAAAKLTVGEDIPPPAGLARVHINRGVGWEQQGFPGLDGYGWYFQNLQVPEEFAGKKHLYLYLRGVNEQAWVYLNGEAAFERTYASTGKGPSELAGVPIGFDAAQWLKPGAPNRIAIRVTHATRPGRHLVPRHAHRHRRGVHDGAVGCVPAVSRGFIGAVGIMFHRASSTAEPTTPKPAISSSPRRGATVRPMNVGAVLKSCSYGLKYVIGHQLFGKTVPLIRGLVLTNRCNLRCRHCRVDARGPMDLDFAEVVAAIDAFHREGGRCLYLEGGEPFLWHDGQQGLDDVVDYAHGLGFLTVVVYTNGTLPIRTSADTVFVSVDGLRDTHDALRGKSFDRIMGNIRDSAHASLYVNYTINNRNKDEIREFCEHVHGMEQHPWHLLLLSYAILWVR